MVGRSQSHNHTPSFYPRGLPGPPLSRSQEPLGKSNEQCRVSLRDRIEGRHLAPSPSTPCPRLSRLRPRRAQRQAGLVTLKLHLNGLGELAVAAARGQAQGSPGGGGGLGEAAGFRVGGGERGQHQGISAAGDLVGMLGQFQRAGAVSEGGVGAGRRAASRDCSRCLGCRVRISERPRNAWPPRGCVRLGAGRWPGCYGRGRKRAGVPRPGWKCQAASSVCPALKSTRPRLL